jgi:glycosyltransferase involved in cell wall biosynthesis
MSQTPRAQRVLFIVENVALARDHRLRKQTATLSSAGYHVSVICRRDPGNDTGVGIRLYDYAPPRDGASKLGFLREYGYSWAMAALLTAKVFLIEGFDVIQITGTPDIYFTIAAPFKLLGKRVVVDQRDLSPELYELRFGRRDLVYRALRGLESASYRTADHVVTVNGSLRRVAYRRGRLPEGAVSVVGNGPVLAHTRSRAPRAELKHGKRFMCCWLGLMGPQDHVDLALRAIQHLVQVTGRSDCVFTFIGDGESRAAAEQLAVELGIADFVSFTGWLEEKDVFDYLATADVGLEPNLEEIVSPVKGMEYMAFGVPFVAFDLEETRTLAGPAAAYAAPTDIVDFARIIDELLNDPERRAEMGRAGKQRVLDEIAWEHQQATYLRVFQALFSPGGRRRRSDRSPTRTREGVS